MNIILVSSEFPESQYAPTGGIGTYAQNLLFGLTSLGHRVFLITSGNKSTNYYGSGVQVFNAQLFPKQLRLIKTILPLNIVTRIVDFLEYPLLFNLGVYLRLKHLLKNIKIDIIEGNDFGGELFLALLLLKKRPPVVLRLHTPSFVIQKYNNEEINLFYIILGFLEKYSLKKADSLYSPTISLAKIITQSVKRKVSALIPYPFKPLYQPRRIKRKTNTLVYIGKLQPKKGVLDLIEALPKVLEKLPAIQIYFIGPDTLYNGKSVKNMLIKKLSKFKLLNSIHFISQINKKRLYSILKETTITAVPSKWENFPHVVLEAMSCGSCVVVANTGGLTEIISDRKNGLIINFNIPNLAADKIIFLFKNLILQKKIILGGSQTLSLKYDMSLIMHRTIKYFQKCIKNTR